MAASPARFGTRKREIARRLVAAASGLALEIVKFETTGDSDQLGKLLPHDGRGGAIVAEWFCSVRCRPRCIRSRTCRSMRTRLGW